MGKLVVTLDWPYSNVPWIWVSSLLASDVIKEKNFEIIRAITTDTNCSGNMLIKASLEAGATEILSFSADQAFPKDVLSRLRAHNKDCVSALTPTRQAGHHWLAFNLNEQGLGVKADLKYPLQRIDVAGGGCMLTKAHVFEKIEPPWFKATKTKDGCGIVQTCDFYFFKKLKEAGFEAYVDNTLESYHQTEVILSSQTLGVPLPYIERIVGNEYIPVTAAEVDEQDRREELYEDSTTEIIWKS